MKAGKNGRTRCGRFLVPPVADGVEAGGEAADIDDGQEQGGERVGAEMRADPGQAEG